MLSAHNMINHIICIYIKIFNALIPGDLHMCLQIGLSLVQVKVCYQLCHLNLTFSKTVYLINTKQSMIFQSISKLNPIQLCLSLCQEVEPINKWPWFHFYRCHNLWAFKCHQDEMANPKCPPGFKCEIHTMAADGLYQQHVNSHGTGWAR